MGAGSAAGALAVHDSVAKVAREACWARTVHRNRRNHCREGTLRRGSADHRRRKRCRRHNRRTCWCRGTQELWAVATAVIADPQAGAG